MKVKDLIRKLSSLNDIKDYEVLVMVESENQETPSIWVYDSITVKDARVAIFDEGKEVILTFER